MRNIALALAISALVASDALAGPVSGFFSSGTLSNPDYTGNVLLPNGSTQFYDNTATGNFVPLTPSFFVWGNFPADGTFSPSFLAFTPNTGGFSTTGDDDEVFLGRLDFGNGNSEFAKLIFGIDLTLNVTRTDSGTDPVDPLTFHIDIVTSSNSGFDPVFDADSLIINGVPAPNTISAFENGPGVYFDLFGKIVGDPMIELTRIEISPLSPEMGAGGIIQNAPRAVAVPEPSSFVLCALGGLGLLGFGWRNRRRFRSAV